jgi:hypothetical protein
MVTDLAGSPAVPRPAATRAVAEAFERWDSTHARALAVANGTMSGAVRRAVGDGIGDFEARDRRALAARLALNGSRSEATVARAAVAATANRTRALGEEFLSTVAERGLERVGTAAGRRLGRSLATVPAGLPVAPVPGYWAATVNAWRVTVRGQYQRFTVSATAGSPHPAPTVRYRRTAETVAFDVNGDGEPETLGRNEPVSFAVTTSVVVAVPPGKSGVGDVDGTADERSPGWPDPGPTAQRQGL